MPITPRRSAEERASEDRIVERGTHEGRKYLVVKERAYYRAFVGTMIRPERMSHQGLTSFNMETTILRKINYGADTDGLVGFSSPENSVHLDENGRVLEGSEPRGDDENVNYVTPKTMVEYCKEMAEALNEFARVQAEGTVEPFKEPEPETEPEPNGYTQTTQFIEP
jgi:hypothetical protein